MSDQFVHLHCHTEFSMLDGAARIKDLFAGAERMGMPALAITDHGNLFGAYEFYKASKSFGVKPIIGLEAYLTPRTHRSERKRVQFGDGTGDDVASKGAYTHMTMWAADPAGMHNLFRLSSRSSLEGFFYKPRADRELLNEYGKGLIATTGCPSGEVQTFLRLGQYDNAVAAAAEFRDIFGEGNFYVELMDHGLDIETRVRHDLLRLAKDLSLPLVASNDLHYVHADDADAHDTLLCVSAGSRKAQQDRFRFDGNGYYLKSPAEMRALFREVPEACDNTLAIAERIETSFDEGMGTFMPKFPVPDGETEDTWFHKEVERGLHERYRGNISDEVRRRAEFETNVIASMGFTGYFLVVADFINWAKKNGIRVGPGRGSGAGSICAYALRITDLCPLQHGLLFERFLNPERVSMPDFDIDFDDRRRSEVIAYVSDRYGSDKVAQIVTYGSIKAKAAVKDAARVLDMPFAIGEQITKAMPADVMGKGVPLADLFDEQHKRYAEGNEFRELYQSSPDVRTVVDTAKGLEGLKRQWGVHAAGVIMSSDPLIDIIPLMKREADGAIITQFDYPGCESLGLIKMDFLGLRNLTVLDDAVRNIKLNRDFDLDLDELVHDMTDKASYDLLASGETLGIFQLDGGGMRTLLRQMQPDNFEDISAALALYRPGPMGAQSHTNYALRKTGLQEIVPIHPELAEPLEDILSTTHGLIVYQEQVQQIAQRVAGYSLGKADLLRRAMGKKKKEVLDAEFVPFSEGMKANGYSDGAIKALWEILVPFSDYAFNKAHTAAYGVISYWTAYLKANYPVEYMAALLQSVRDDKDKSALYLAECRRMGIEVLPPDVNSSEVMFTPVGDHIRFGLGAVRNVGDKVVTAWVAERAVKGPATDFHDFLDKAPLLMCNKRVIESLIKAGAFDEMGHTRRSLMGVFETAVDSIIDVKRNAENGQDGFDFGFDVGGGDAAEQRHDSVPEVDEWDRRTKLAFEREMLGLYVSDHPLNGLEHVLQTNGDRSVASIAAADGYRGQTKVCGLITAVNRRVNKAGNIWAQIVIEDLTSSIEVTVFPRTYDQVAAQLAPDTIVTVEGTAESGEDRGRMRASNVYSPHMSAEGQVGPLALTLPAVRCTPGVVNRLKEILAQYPGAAEVHLALRSGEQLKTFKLGEGYRVELTSALFADLKAVLGPSCVGVGRSD
ncbi:DNA polymerase III subunit alpha [Tessaracoccus flavus]|uniref:DNA polymerase III subunit alpha n=1 Tax=Tessaracoccus flavus TaxID=1610493 RepID=A0A1Q2CEF3_9ACTN|nr:DNA polymerase III subunit alpha [Tessaracoccus flavus]AQP44486.1 DNA polymerase III subunit alpha [Tessaracoccus flavus]SDY70872.1 DNA polymerase III, alpha subunit [Tessaracoccus flavus]